MVRLSHLASVAADQKKAQVEERSLVEIECSSPHNLRLAPGDRDPAAGVSHMDTAAKMIDLARWKDALLDIVASYAPAHIDLENPIALEDCFALEDCYTLRREVADFALGHNTADCFWSCWLGKAI